MRRKPLGQHRDENQPRAATGSNRLNLSQWVATTAIVGCAVAYSPSASHADSVDNLKEVLTRLQARVHSLEAAERTGGREDRAAAKAAKRAQKEAEEARARAEEARLDAEAAREKTKTALNGADPLKGSFPGSMRIPSTNTSFKIYGYGKVNAYGDLGPQNRTDSISVSSIPLSSGALGAKTPGDIALNARYSRVDVETRTPISESFGNVRTLFEVDFAGQSDLTSQTVASSFTTRLRLAFGEFGRTDGWGAVVAGQTYSIFNDCTLNPIRSVSDWTMPATSAVRQAVVQYSKTFGSTTVSVGLENPYSDITSSTGTSYPDSNGGAGLGGSGTPDVTARVVWRGDGSFFALRGMARNIEINNGAAIPSQRYTASTLGYGIGATGGLNLLDNRLALFATANYGPGIGRYDIISTGFGAVTNFGLPGVTAQTAKLNAVTTTAGFVGLQYFILPNLQTNAFVAAASLNYPNYVTQFATTSSAVNKSLWATSANLIYSPVPSIDLGVEYQHGSRTLLVTNANGVDGGTADRIQGMVLVRF